MPHRKGIRTVGNSMPPSQPIAPQPRNPRYVPPWGDNRPIEKLPPEVLAYIFELGKLAEEHLDDWEVEEDDGNEEYEDVEDEDVVYDGDDDEPMKMPGTFTVNKFEATNGRADTKKYGLEDRLNLSFAARMSHVCRRWRQIALNTPVLWSTLDFLEPRPFVRSQEWLARSKQCPLDLILDLSVTETIGGDMDMTDEERDSQRDATAVTAIEDLTCILDLTIPHVHRWQTFEVTVSIYEHMHYVLKRLEACPGAPLLQSLRLYCHEDHDDLAENLTMEEFRRQFLPFGGHVPKLSQLELWGVHLDWKMLIPVGERSSVPSVYLNKAPSVTTNLTELELAYHTKAVQPSYEDFVNIIRCAPNLSSLKFTSSGPSSHQQGLLAGPFSLCLRNLRHLTLGFFDEEYAMSLWDLVTPPNLTSIALDFDEGDYTRFVNRLVTISQWFSLAFPFQAVSGRPRPRISTITNLKLGGLPCADTCAYKLYSTWHSLERLYLNMHFLPYTFFSVLINEDEAPRLTSDGRLVEMLPNEPRRGRRKRDMKGPVLCKQLEVVTFSGLSGSDYVRFVKKRRAVGAPIRELNIDCEDYISEKHKAWLQKSVQILEFVEISDDEGVAFLNSYVDSDGEEMIWALSEDDGSGDEEDEDGDEGMGED